ncbi:hypothetical protein RHGRI_035937 [Rhododendron griersonianum]|uniref:Protein kinase domain-containing protein n=1 Tax=Rhododendron griersonianum TaxID=479676 RepID=A0AAV6HQ59_9ERIC|nr:hypothetical protein RHGRI_035937 [Rhododendron griersonianum]
MHTGTSNASIPSLIGETITGVLPEQQPAATHLYHTFRKHFSQKVSRYATTNSDQEKGTVSPQPSALPVSEQDVDQSSNEGRISASSAPSISKFSLKPSTRDKCSSLGASQASVPPSHPHTTPLEKKDLDNEASSVGTATIQGTPAKLDANHVGGLSVDNNIFDILPENLLESIKEKERQALEEKDPAISQAKRRQKMIASLPKLFDMIRFLIQSIKHSVVTKEEFMHRIVANHLDIVDRREVEEQLKLLQELAPEWIYEKLASGGGLLIWQAFHLINKMFSPDSMRARLVEAKSWTYIASFITAFISLQVGDFGLSRIKRNTLVSGGVRGTLPWMAPELLNGSSSRVSEKVDVFSFVITLWEILTGEEPYANMHCGAIIGGILKNTLRPPIPERCDLEWRKLMEECWSTDAEARPSFTEITNRLRSMSVAAQGKGQSNLAR